MSQLKGVVSHHEREIAELRADWEPAFAYLNAAMESLDNPDERAAGLWRCAPWPRPLGFSGQPAQRAGCDVVARRRAASLVGAVPIAERTCSAEFNGRWLRNTANPFYPARSGWVRDRGLELRVIRR